MPSRIALLLAVLALPALAAKKQPSPTKSAKPAGKSKSVAAPAKPAAPAKGSMTDSRDGKTYRTVVIGTQTWMAQNLDFKATGSACYDNKKQNCEELGRMYDWEMAKTACPDGWHLPTEDEWDLLEKEAGGEIAGYNLKSSSGWDNQGNGTDSKGFDGIPSGDLSKTGLYSHRGVGASYWTASSKFGGGAWFRALDFFDKKLIHDNAEKSSGFSVRCVKGPAK